MAIKDWNGFKKSGDTYIPNDATARAGVTATVDLMKDTTGWIGKNKAVFHGKGIYDLNTGVYTPLDPTNYGAWKKISCKGGEKFVFVCNNAINQVIWYEWNGDTFISSTPHSDLTSSYDEYTVGSNTTLVACVARLTGGNITDDSDFGNPMIADAVAYSLSPTYEPYHESVEDWYWSENAKTGVHNFLNTEKFETSTKDGITSTLRADKGISLTGTPTIQSGTIFFRNYGTVLKAGTYKYKLNKRPKGTCIVGINDSLSYLGNYKIIAQLTTNLTEISFTVTDEDLASKPYVFCELGVYYNAGTIDEVYYPQILLNEDTFGSFMPFAMTNTQLTEKVQEINSSVSLLDSPTEVGNTGMITIPISGIMQYSDIVVVGYNGSDGGENRFVAVIPTEIDGQFDIGIPFVVKSSTGVGFIVARIASNALSLTFLDNANTNITTMYVKKIYGRKR